MDRTTDRRWGQLWRPISLKRVTIRTSRSFFLIVDWISYKKSCFAATVLFSDASRGEARRRSETYELVFSKEHFSAVLNGFNIYLLWTNYNIILPHYIYNRRSGQVVRRRSRKPKITSSILVCALMLIEKNIALMLKNVLFLF